MPKYLKFLAVTLFIVASFSGYWTYHTKAVEEDPFVLYDVKIYPYGTRDMVIVWQQNKNQRLITLTSHRKVETCQGYRVIVKNTELCEVSYGPYEFGLNITWYTRNETPSNFMMYFVDEKYKLWGPFKSSNKVHMPIVTK
jgi:hypothetical protein